MNGINTSFWESVKYQSDIIIVGAGFLGSWTAYELSKLYPSAKITVLERDSMSYGASIRNAGFACFGSLTEIISDSEKYGETQALNLVEQRFKGIQKIKSVFVNSKISFESTGGTEILDFSLRDKSLSLLSEINKKMEPVTGSKSSFIQREESLIFNRYEGLINSYSLLNELHQLCRSQGVDFLFGVNVGSVFEANSQVEVLGHNLDRNFIFKAGKAIVCVNAFSNKIDMLKHKEIIPQRNHVLVTSELDFNFDTGVHALEGYIYFRPVYIKNKKHLLIGGARHIALNEESVTHTKSNDKIISYLRSFIKEKISAAPFEILYQWTGFMGFTEHKKNLLQNVSENVVIACACNGMGVAMCPTFSEKVAQSI